MPPDVLKERLRILGFTPKTFAKRIGASERTVRRWWNGEQEIPNWVGVMLDLMKDAHDRGHGEFYEAWNKAFIAVSEAFSEWISKESPDFDDITLEIGALISELCKRGNIKPRSLTLGDD